VETLVGIGMWGPLLIIIGLIGTWWILLRSTRRFAFTSKEYQLAVEAIAVLGVLTVRTTVMGVIMSQPPIQYFAILGYAEFLRRRYMKNVVPQTEASVNSALPDIRAPRLSPPFLD
jgi:hypothetical protein